MEGENPHASSSKKLLLPFRLLALNPSLKPMASVRPERVHQIRDESVLVVQILGGPDCQLYLAAGHAEAIVMCDFDFLCDEDPDDLLGQHGPENRDTGTDARERDL